MLPESTKGSYFVHLRFVNFRRNLLTSEPSMHCCWQHLAEGLHPAHPLAVFLWSGYNRATVQMVLHLGLFGSRPFIWVCLKGNCLQDRQMWFFLKLYRHGSTDLPSLLQLQFHLSFSQCKAFPYCSQKNPSTSFSSTSPLTLGTQPKGQAIWAGHPSTLGGAEVPLGTLKWNAALCWGLTSPVLVDLSRSRNEGHDTVFKTYPVGSIPRKGFSHNRLIQSS